VDLTTIGSFFPKLAKYVGGSTSNSNILGDRNLNEKQLPNANLSINNPLKKPATAP
jgi:hypothetical protein